MHRERETAHWRSQALGCLIAIQLACSSIACSAESESELTGPVQADGLPDWVDHEPLQPPIRDQGGRGTCAWFAWAAAVESYYGLTDWLSVEQMGARLGFSMDIAMNWQVLNTFLAREQYWPYNGTGQPGLDESSVYGIAQTTTLTGDEEEMKAFLAASPTNNVVLGYFHEKQWEDGDGVMVNPQINWADASWRKLNCNVRFWGERCGGHMVLIVGYGRMMDSDGEIRTFYKFRNSWGPYWGAGGYGYMSHEYLKYMGWSATAITMGTLTSAAAPEARFCPMDNVTRAEMARYLERIKHRLEPDWEPTDPTVDPFADYARTERDAPWVRQLAEDRITNGCRPAENAYCPTDPVPREQMAAFLVRLKYNDLVLAGREDLIPIDDPADLTRFVDVTGPGTTEERHQFARYIARLYEDGITTGRDATHFDPTALVPREEMATFLMRFAHPELIGNPPAATGRFGDITDPNSKRDFEGFIELAVQDGIMEACNW